MGNHTSNYRLFDLIYDIFIISLMNYYRYVLSDSDCSRIIKKNITPSKPVIPPQPLKHRRYGHHLRHRQRKLSKLQLKKKHLQLQNDYLHKT